jgi:hypothetical protein
MRMYDTTCQHGLLEMIPMVYSAETISASEGVSDRVVESDNNLYHSRTEYKVIGKKHKHMDESAYIRNCSDRRQR